MSCIENNKVVPEDWVLNYISEKLNLDINYLNHDVREQIQENIKTLERKPNNATFIEDITYNLDYAEGYEYYDLGCMLLHLLFDFYLEKEKYEDLSVIIPRYYHLCQKSKDEILMVNYYMDIAKYLYNNKEFNQACSYFTTVRKTLKEKGLKNTIQYAKATYNECASYIMAKEFDKAYSMAEDLEEVVLLTDDYILKGEVYQLLAMLFISFKVDKFYEYKEKSISCYGENSERKCRAIHNFAVTLFNNGFKDTAVEYIKEAVAEFPVDNKARLCEFLKFIIDTLIENNELDLAQTHCDNMLNLAISLNNINYIERAYYFKSSILQMQNNYLLAETYMNLSLDALVKFGSRAQVHKRYLEMGNMYHKLGEIKESIKFFNLALQLEKKI